jgi:hypothetical protein
MFETIPPERSMDQSWYYILTMVCGAMVTYMVYSLWRSTTRNILKLGTKDPIEIDLDKINSLQRAGLTMCQVMIGKERVDKIFDCVTDFVSNKSEDNNIGASLIRDVGVDNNLARLINHNIGNFMIELKERMAERERTNTKPNGNTISNESTRTEADITADIDMEKLTAMAALKNTSS